MSKPADIPQDVWDTVERSIYNGMDTFAAGLTVARLIMAEREACARVAEGMRHGHLNLLAQEVTRARAEDIAAAIRNRSDAP